MHYEADDDGNRVVVLTMTAVLVVLTMTAVLDD